MPTPPPAIVPLLTPFAVAFTAPFTGALSDVLGKKLPFDSLQQLRAKLYGEYPHLARIDHVEPGNADDIARVAKLGGRLNKGTFTSPVADFYLTNPIARASAVMAECSALAKNGFRQAAE
jgi:NADH-quinone oxidoreductase subunit G